MRKAAFVTIGTLLGGLVSWILLAIVCALLSTSSENMWTSIWWGTLIFWQVIPIGACIGFVIAMLKSKD